MAFDASARPNTRNIILGVVLTAYLMILLDLSIVYTGMPEIGKTMKMSPVSQTWVQNAYLLFFGGFLLLSARLGDTFGRQRILKVGVVLFTVASFVIGIAQSSWELIAARTVQGVGASILAPSVLAIISTTFPEDSERTRALAWYSVVAGAGASLGIVVLGGIFADLLSWRIGFLVNIPIGIGLWFGITRYIPESDRIKGHFDLMGAFTSTMGVGLLVYGLVNAADAGWFDRVTLATLFSSAVVISFFVWHERRVDVPVLPMHLLYSRERSAACLTRMLCVGSIVSFFFFGTQFMQQVLGYSALQAGLGFLPMTLVQFVAAIAIPRVTRLIGNIPMLMGSLFLISLGLFWLASASNDASFWQLGLPMVLIGIGNGGAMAPMTASAVRGVEIHDQGAVSGLVNVAHQLGGSIGLSALIVVFAAGANPRLTAPVEMSHQISAVFIGAAVMNLLGLALTAIFILPANRKNNSEYEVSA
ncbi:MFS transporter [Zymomonas sp.]|uniref:MFS transporter n=1 Tax=Zymomonas sp. TaxID=2068624 RepID=UPI0025E5AA69|nr:MFS transporter [Zymomonas sp.]MCA1956842.1 MFS transporter [Zymomonas sp.]